MVFFYLGDVFAYVQSPRDVGWLVGGGCEIGGCALVNVVDVFCVVGWRKMGVKM